MKALVLVLTVVLLSCSKDRPLELKETQKRDLISMEDFNSNKVFQDVPKIWSAPMGPVIKENYTSFRVHVRDNNQLIFFGLQKESNFYDRLIQEEFDGKLWTPLFWYDVEFVRLLVKKNDLGEETNNYEILATSLDKAQYLRIDLDTATKTYPDDPNETYKKDLENKAKTLLVKNFVNKEFLYRRTLIDSPNIFDYSFAGSSGRLEIVKFLFYKNRVDIVRADPLLAKDGVSSVDYEVLLSFPASYLKKSSIDSRGNPLGGTRLVSANPGDKDVVAFVNWGKNTLSQVKSPLSKYTLGSCFSGVQSRTIENVRKTSGKELHFSLVSTYPSSSLLECTSYEGYFGTTQTTFTFKERLSFQEYKKDDEKVLLDVPYESQKKMGFGIFTYNKKNPDAFGNTHLKGGQKSLGAILDLKAGWTYTLAGIPEIGEGNTKEKKIWNKKLRREVILSTQKVVADINDALNKALNFENSPLPLKNVIKLEVEGLTTEEEKEYGLKNASFKVMGDLDRNYIYYVRKGTKSSVIGLGGSHHNPRTGKVEAASVYIYGGNMLGSVYSMKKMAKAKQEYQKNMTGVSGSVSLRKELPLETFAEIKESFKKEASEEASTNASTTPANLTMNPVAKDFLVKYQYAKEKGDFSPDFLYSIFEGKVEQGKVVPNEFFAKRASTLKKLEKNDFCVFSRENISGVAHADDSDMELLMKMYRPTLAHEIGHNLGLRHNFIASVDKKNFFHSPEDEEEQKKRKNPRDHSSVMDYMLTDHETYDGLGPYDVFALRAAYTKTLKTQDGFVSLDKLKKDLNLNYWEDLTKTMVKNQKVKNFKFCSDDEAGRRPTCYRFDSGTSPMEIAGTVIDDYNAYYSLRNFPGNKREFRGRQGVYIARTLGKFRRLRQFLDEALLILFNDGYDPATITRYVKHLQAALMAYDFFEEVIRMPDTSGAKNRFEVETLQQGEKILPMVFERRSLENVRIDGRNSQLKVRGNEWDKIAAILMLTGRNEISRANQENFVASYYTIRKLLNPKFKRVSSKLLTLLDEILSGQIKPYVSTYLVKEKDGKKEYELVKKALNLKAPSTFLMKEFTRWGIFLNLDFEGMGNLDDSGASAFRVYSKTAPIKNMLGISQLGSRFGEKYWSTPDSPFSYQGVMKVTKIDLLLKSKDSIKKEVENYLETESEDALETFKKFNLSYDKFNEVKKEIDEDLAWLESTKELESDQKLVISSPQVEERVKVKWVNKLKEKPTLLFYFEYLVEKNEVYKKLLPKERTLTSFRATLFKSLRKASRFNYEVNPSTRF